MQEHIYSLSKTTCLEEPILYIEIWDDDVFSRDDFLGENLEFKILMHDYNYYDCSMYVSTV